jgi:sugar transferase (PEP-CTERM/EpsH1 system associated)
MEGLLYLAHRLPYPPNKGDKIRSYQLLKFLGKRYRVFLGTFVDSADDLQYVDNVREHCADVCVERLNPTAAKIRSALWLAGSRALTLAYYHSPSLQRWADRTIAEQGIRKALVFCSSMSQFIDAGRGMKVVTDFVDVDSAKWVEYAKKRPWPLSWVYRREGERLFAFERAVASASAASAFCTPAEVELFTKMAPETASKVHVIRYGVDTDYFAPAADRASPYAAGECAIAFTGAMDYWPNVDAVCWFASEVLPELAKRVPGVRFYVVGMNPTPAVKALEADSRVVVTGKVPDVRPYLQHAAAVVAPLRVARGVQNKVLEAMAMARPVVVSAVASGGIEAKIGTEFGVASGETDFVEKVQALLDRKVGDEMGALARNRILTSYGWGASLERFAELLGDGAPMARAAGATR